MGCIESKNKEKEWEQERAKKEAELKRVIAALSATPFFLQLSDEELEAFAGHFVLEALQAGVKVVEQGAVADSFFVLANGAVEIYVRGDAQSMSNDTSKSESWDKTAEDADGVVRLESIRVRSQSKFQSEVSQQLTREMNVFVNSLRPGDFFGSNALRTGTQTRPATIITTEPSVVLRLSRTEFDQFLASHPQRRQGLMDTIGQKMEHHLQTVPFLRGVDSDKLEFLASMFRYVSLRKNDVLFKEGDLGLSMYIVLNGAVSPRVENEETSAPQVVLGPGNYFGEVALLVDIPRTASIMAVEDSLLLELRKSDYHRMITLVPALKSGFDHITKQRAAAHFRRYRIPFFNSIPEDKFENLVSLCTLTQYRKNEIIFREGDTGDAFYIIMYGQVSIRASKDGQVFEITQMGPGQYFGEVALVRDTLRTATVVTVERSVIMSIQKQDFQAFFATCPEALADFHVKLARYEITLQALINHDEGRKCFTKYLESEFSAENINFWIAARDYAAIQDEEQRKTIGTQIFNQYLAANAPEQVNINSQNRSEVESGIAKAEFTPNLFVSSAADVFSLMASDSFKRFKQGDLFQQFLSAMQVYEKNSTMQEKLQ